MLNTINGGGIAFRLNLNGTFTDAMYLNGSGNVGIGTTTPAALLHLEGPDSVLNLENTDPSYGAGDVLQFGHNQGGSTIPAAKIRSFLVNGDGAGSRAGNLIFSTSNAGVVTDQMTILYTGNVGIGTTNPGANPPSGVSGTFLEVNGNVMLTQNGGGKLVFQDGSVQTTAFIPANCGADYAESVGVTGDRTAYQPGDVLVIDPNAPGKFLKANQAYSTMVAGIYSTKPGYVGRLQPASDPASANEIPMAMVGRVPTKVSAENGPIKVGDLLVTSSTMGYAMKGTDRSQLTGAVVGKALGSLDSGTGTILVLVTLQ
jgi:hypothetical protein